jgi:O-succinylbenzoic acid--CoA ligase
VADEELPRAELTWADLGERVRRLLPALRRRMRGGERAALVGETDLATLETLYALIELGMPTVLLHPGWSRSERRRLLDACAPVVEIEPEKLARPPAGQGARVRGRPRPIPTDRALAVVPTSGTSGDPKGVVLSRRAFLASAEASAENLGWEDGDRWLLGLPVAHVGGLSILTRCLIARRTVVVQGGRRFDAAEVAGLVERHRVTLMSLVPTTLKRLLHLAPPWEPPSWLRAVLLGGAGASPALLAAAADRGVPVLATYGLTEACSQVATQAYGTVQRGEMGCGPPLPGTEVRIRDGGIEVRGLQLMNGYLPPSDEDPWTEDGWLSTGDLGRLDGEGRLHVLGRRDDVIVSGGENVRAAEVERALEEHPAIAAACVFGVEDEEWGRTVAAAVVASSEAPSDAELERHLRARLAGFKLPRRIAYLPELVRLPSGKVDRERTAERALPGLRPFRRRSPPAPDPRDDRGLRQPRSARG